MDGIADVLDLFIQVDSLAETVATCADPSQANGRGYFYMEYGYDQKAFGRTVYSVYLADGTFHGIYALNRDGGPMACLGRAAESPHHFTGDPPVLWLPCPFCGNDGGGLQAKHRGQPGSHTLMTDTEWYSRGQYRVVCRGRHLQGCSGTGPFSETESGAIAAWNKRFIPTEKIGLYISFGPLYTHPRFRHPSFFYAAYRTTGGIIYVFGSNHQDDYEPIVLHDIETVRVNQVTG